MVRFRFAVFLAVLAVSNAEVTPIDKVIDLIEGMKQSVEDEGRAEAKAYGDFACFCKKTTKEKSDSIKTENDNIDVSTADIADKTASKEEDKTELAKRKDDEVKLSTKLSDAEAAWAKALAEYQVEEADFSAAISSLKSAIKAMKDSKPAASLLQVREELTQTLRLADAMNMVVAAKHRGVASFLQSQASVDPNNPEYEYHSTDILDLLEQLLGEFKEGKETLDTEHDKAKKAAKAMQASLKKEIQANKDAMVKLTKSIEKYSKEIAKHTEDLVNSQGILKDDELYLKDLTDRCEARASDFDQRSSMRDDEITALSTALKVLKDEVKPADEVNERALFLQRPQSPSNSQSKVEHSLHAEVVEKSVSLLQQHKEETHARSARMRGTVSLEDRRDRALAMLSVEGERLNSLVLTSLAAKSAADPFKKVKGLIEKLIQRLITEAKNEATKKGFCDTELGKARKDRDFRYSEARDISTDLAGLEAKEEELVTEIKTLTREIKEETKAFKEATAERNEEKDTNMETIKTAKEGLEAVTEALQVLRAFYKQAAKAVLLQASPVDEDTDGAGFSGSYQGNQSGSKAVLDLLETIQSDFDRTIRTTDAAEKQAYREFVAFSQHSKASIAGKETKVNLDEQDLETTRTKLKTKTEDLHTAMDLLDRALMELEDLKPTCIDTGMSYSERVKKREEEMEALKKALCILDEESNVEKECQS